MLLASIIRKKKFLYKRSSIKGDKSGWDFRFLNTNLGVQMATAFTFSRKITVFPI